MTKAYPLQWPEGWPRTIFYNREDARWKFAREAAGQRRAPITLNYAVKSLIDELERMGAENIVISTNIVLRLDGLPRSGQRTPEDPGVAVFFAREGDAVSMARDAFTRPEDNIRSLALAISGLRQTERHGGDTMLKRAFQGFTALPPPDQMSTIVTPVSRQWYEILGVAHDCPIAVAEAAWKALSRSTPENKRREINNAIEGARKALT